MTAFATLVIMNGSIITMDRDRPEAEAIAISGNRIAAIGSNEAVAEAVGPRAEVIDAKGATVLPGFNDSHVHIFGGSAGLAQLSLDGVRSLDALEAAVRDYAADHPELALLIANSASYSIAGHRRITRHDLDRIVADRPFMMVAFDHHTAWANTIALERAGILQGGDVGIGNEIVMADDGLASGELREANAIRPVSLLGESGGREMLGLSTGGEPEHVTDEDRESDKDLLRRGMAYCATLGITSIQNMDGNLYQLELLDEIERDEGLPIRIRMPFHMKNDMPMSAIEDKAAVWRERFNTDKLRCDFVKLFMDGVTESETALFVEPYAHRPGWKGEPLFTQSHFDAIATEATKAGLQIAVHAVGDGAVRMVLNGYEKALDATGKTGCRHRIEHIETVHPDDLPRFAEIGAVASMQPTHAPVLGNADDELSMSFVPQERWPQSFAWHTLSDAGAPMVFSTDWPIAPAAPMVTLQAAMTRQPWRAELPDQRLPLDEVLHAYTANGAWVEFQEDRKGVLKPGYLADIVILDRDIRSAAADELGAVRPMTTICDGRITFQS